MLDEKIRPYEVEYVVTFYCKMTVHSDDIDNVYNDFHEQLEYDDIDFARSSDVEIVDIYRQSIDDEDY